MMSSKETIDVIRALTIGIHTCVSMSVTMGVTMGVAMDITIRIHTYFTERLEAAPERQRLLLDQLQMPQ